MHNQSIVVLVDSQAAIKALIKCTVTQCRRQSKRSEEALAKSRGALKFAYKS